MIVIKSIFHKTFIHRFPKIKNISLIIILTGLMATPSFNYTQAKPGGNFYVYVSLRDDNAIAIYNMNKTDGSLTLIGKQDVEGGPGCMNLDPSRKFLYVCQRGKKALTSFKINRKTGQIILLNSVPAVDNPVYNATDKTGKYLLTAYYAAGKAAVYPLSKDGRIDASAVQVLQGFVHPHCIQSDNSNKYVYLADKGGDKIYQYKFNESSGRLSPNTPPEVISPKGTGPRHFVFNNSNTIVYFSDELNGTITAYKLSDNNSTLTLFQTISTLPDNYKGPNTTAEIRLTSDNKFLYASNRGPDDITAFSVGAKNGKLKKIGNYSTRKTPRAFQISPDGKYLIAAGEDSNNLQTYRINKETGALESLNITGTGARPSWILIIDHDAK